VAKKDSEADDVDDGGRVRLDKWLWAARFFKTRRLAIEACDAGRVKIGDQSLRPGRNVNVGETLSIARADLVWEVVVTALSVRRGPATEAVKLYRETDQGRAKREAEMARHKAEAALGPAPKGRPTKRDRRHFDRYFGSGGDD
jgi:ribosome-associated heat shock protein Hsp15